MTAPPGPVPASPTAPIPTLDYSHPARLQSKPGLYRAAVWCALVPIVVGTAILLTWLLAGGAWLMVAGMYTILGGLGLFLVGGCCLIAYAWRETRVGLMPRPTLIRRFFLCALLFLANFVLAFGYVAAAAEVMSTFVVIIKNDGSRPVDSFTLSGSAPGNRPVEPGPIEPGGEVRRKFSSGDDGDLRYAIRQGSQSGGGEITSYAGGGERYILTVDDEGDVTMRVRQR